MHARTAALCLVALTLIGSAAPGHVAGAADVAVLRAPHGALQPRAAIDRDGRTHLVFFAGDPAHGDVFYARLESGPWSRPLRVNSTPGSAIAIGTVRGPQLSIGRGGRPHVAWLGSDRAEPRANGGATPMLYTRLSDAGTAFEPERNLVQFAVGLDGGGTVAADPSSGLVYVLWHAGGPAGKDEGDRRVWVARSTDEGRTFGREAAASPASTGACGCCGLAAEVDRRGSLFTLYRSARDVVHRDTYLLASQDQGATFSAQKLAEWNIGACPMSTYALAESADGILAAWETAGEIYWQPVRASGRRGDIVTPSGSTGKRKHPSIAANSRGDVLVAWTEDTGWNRGGTVAWQMFDGQGKPKGAPGRAEDLPAWSLASVISRPDGGFVVVY